MESRKNNTIVGPLVRVSRPFWQSSERRKGAFFLGMAILFTLGLVASQFVMTQWNSRFYDSLQKYDFEGFKRSGVEFVVVTTLVMGVTGAQFFFAESLGVRWRKVLTEYGINRWLTQKNLYFWNHIAEAGDNPDQRISQDVDLFVKGVLNLGIEAFKMLCTFVVFIGLLWRLSDNYRFFGHHVPGYLVWFSVAYALLGSGLSHLIGNKVGPLNQVQQNREADLRFHLMRTREHAESIVLMKGNQAEERKLTQALHLLIDNYRQLIRKNAHLKVFSSGYFTFISALPFLIAGRSYFNHQVTLGQIVETGIAFNYVTTSMSYMVQVYAQYAEWSAAVRRIDGYMDAMNRAEVLGKDTDAKMADGPNLTAEGVTLRLPDASTIAENIDKKLVAGDSLVIVGASGAGKSTLLRVFAGLWPFFEGKVIRPIHKRLMFLPQKPYIPKGTLREVLAYPLEAPALDEAQVKEILQFCGLEKFITQLDVEQLWSQTLSPGEQQRLGWARVFLHKPEVLFLDEATSALDEAMQQRLYEAIEKKIPGVTTISIAHRSELHEYHRQRIDFTPRVSVPLAQGA